MRALLVEYRDKMGTLIRKEHVREMWLALDAAAFAMDTQPSIEHIVISQDSIMVADIKRPRGA